MSLCELRLREETGGEGERAKLPPPLQLKLQLQLKLKLKLLWRRPGCCCCSATIAARQEHREAEWRRLRRKSRSCSRNNSNNLCNYHINALSAQRLKLAGPLAPCKQATPQLSSTLSLSLSRAQPTASYIKISTQTRSARLVAGR